MHGMVPLVRKKVYAIADSGADATIVGKHAKVLSYSGRKATIVGYEKSTTRSSEVPIVTALVKARSNIENGIPVLLKIHEAAYLEDNPITLISEYQVRESGMVIDSTANKHRTIDGRFGTQQLYLNEKVSIPFEDRGALMGFELLPIKDNMTGKGMISLPSQTPLSGDHIHSKKVKEGQHHHHLKYQLESMQLFIHLLVKTLKKTRNQLPNPGKLQKIQMGIHQRITPKTRNQAPSQGEYLMEYT